MVLHILVAHQNVVGWRLVYMRTPPTHYYKNLVGEWPTWKLTLVEKKFSLILNP